MDDVLDDTSDVTMSLSVIEGSELRGGLVESVDGSKDAAATFTLISDDSPHLVDLMARIVVIRGRVARIVLTKFEGARDGKCAWAWLANEANAWVPTI